MQTLLQFGKQAIRYIRHLWDGQGQAFKILVSALLCTILIAGIMGVQLVHTAQAAASASVSQGASVRSVAPTSQPTDTPTSVPTDTPTAVPTTMPTAAPLLTFTASYNKTEQFTVNSPFTLAWSCVGDGGTMTVSESFWVDNGSLGQGFNHSYTSDPIACNGAVQTPPDTLGTRTWCGGVNEVQVSVTGYPQWTVQILPVSSDALC